MRWALLIGGMAALLYLWVIDLAFQLDDYWILPRATTLVRETARVATDPDHLFYGGRAVFALEEHGNFQPTLWAFDAAMARLSGRPFRPVVFHLASAALHGLATALLFAFLRRPLGSMPAALAAAWFGMAAAGAQAVTWVSAATHIMVVIAGILTLALLVRTRRDDRLIWWWLAGLCFLLGWWAHTEIMALVPALCVFLPYRRGIIPLLARTVGLFTPLAAGWFLRMRFLGTGSLGYAGGLEPGPGTLMAARVVRAIPDLLGQFVAPFNRHPAVEDIPAGWFPGPAGTALAAVPWVVLTVCVWWRGDARTRALWWRAAVVVGLLIVPALVLWMLYDENLDNRESRGLYPVAAGAAVLVGLGFRATPKPLAIVCGAMLFWVSGASLLQTAQIELRVARRIHTTVTTVIEAARETGAAVIVLDSQALPWGVPALSPRFLPVACRPPFQSERTQPRVLAFPWMDDLLQSHVLLEIEEPIRVLPLQEEILPAIRLPPLPAEPPTLRAIPPVLPDVVSFEPKRPVPPRSIRGFRFAGRPGARRSYFAHTSSGILRFDLRLGKDDHEAVILLDEDPEWLLAETFLGVHAHRTNDPGLDAAPELLMAPPPGPAGVFPPDVSRGSFRVSTGEFRFRSLPAGARLRLRCVINVLGARYRMEYIAPAEALTTLDSGEVVYRTRDEDWVSCTFPRQMAFSTLEALHRDVLQPFGVKHLPMLWRVEVLYPEGNAIRNRTAWYRYLLTPD